MRVALAVEGTRGDVHPLLALGEALGAAGHAVRICAPPDFQGEAESRGFEFRAVGIPVREYLTAHAEAVAGGAWRMLAESQRYARIAIAEQFRTLPGATEGCDLIVGAGVEMAAASAAELHGVPYRYVAYCPVLFPSREHAPFLLPGRELPAWANRLAWGATLVFSNRVLGRGIRGWRATLGLPPVHDLFAHLLGDRPILSADEELAPRPGDCAFDVEQVPCLHPVAGEPLPPKLSSFLDAGPPPVFLGFGSMTDPRPGRTTAALLEAITSLGCRALISRGWAGLGDGPLPEGVFVTGPVAHATLFPRVAAVVHHGGAGTTTTAARAGVPQIVVPHVFDQFYWGRRVAALGLGPPPLARTRLAPRRLVEALAVTLDNEVIAERARGLGERLRARALASSAASLLTA